MTYSGGAIQLSDDQKRDYIKYCLKRGDAPIKPKYLAVCNDPTGHGCASYQPLRATLGLPDFRSLPSMEKVDLAPEDSNQNNEKKRSQNSLEESEPKRIATETNNRNRKRGQNKDRRVNLVAQAEANAQQLCTVVAQTNVTECEKGNTCQFSHDREGIIQIQSMDLGPTCSNFERFGLCRFGLNCRFGSSHIKGGYNIDREGKPVTPETFKLKSDEWKSINELSEDIKQRLRKKEYKFPLKDLDQSLRQERLRQKLSNPLMVDNNNVSSSGDTTSFETINISDLSMELADSADNGRPIGTSEGAIILSDGSHDRVHEIRKRRNEIFCSGKLLLAPLTTVGNLPFRRLCVQLGANVTMSEMALAKSIVEGKPSELALLRRHESEKHFGIQLATGQPNVLADCCHLLEDQVSFDFIDLNCACPLAPLHKKMAGSILMDRSSLIQSLAISMRSSVTSHPISFKMRVSHGDKRNAHVLIPKLESLGVDAFLVHGRTSRQRYTRTADWDYLAQCKAICKSAAFIGNGDVMSWEEYNQRKLESNVDSILIGRGALIKPWIFTEIKEQRLWDISASERLDLMKNFVKFGFDNWGSDSKGVEVTRRYFCEWCSFAHRYIPVGLLEHLPQRVNWRPPQFVGRSDLETLLGSSNVKDWIKLSEMLIGPVPHNFSFVPKHKSNSYDE